MLISDGKMIYNSDYKIWEFPFRTSDYTTLGSFDSTTLGTADYSKLGEEPGSK